MHAHLAQPVTAPSFIARSKWLSGGFASRSRTVVNLYPLVDVDACSKVGIEPLRLALHWVHLGITRLQVRAKSLGSADYLALLREVVDRVPDGVEVFANDRPDLAELSGCCGVHVGQSDLPVRDVLRTFPGLRVGVSTHDLRQLDAALAERPTYVAFGPVFATGSKQNPEPCVGTAGLATAHVRASSAGVPLVAIGGITVDNIARVSAHCEWAALISALTASNLDVVSEAYHCLRAASSGVASATARR